MRFELTINCEHESFTNDHFEVAQETSRLLDIVSNRIQQCVPCGKIRNIDGVIVGAFNFIK